MLRTSRICVVFLFLISLVGFADEGARALYDQGKYQEALDALQKSGLQTAADFYDAANCYYRLGRVGQAIAYYRKAEVLAPNDSDVGYNLKIAEAAAEKSGAGALKDQTFFMGTLVPVARKVPEVYVDLLLALCTGALAWLAYHAKKRALSFMKAVFQPEFLSVFGIWALSCAVTAAVVMAHHAKIAAVVSDVAVGRSGPSDTFTELFKLPAGTTVELTGESRDGWSQVRFSLGNVGWIVEKDLLNL